MAVLFTLLSDGLWDRGSFFVLRNSCVCFLLVPITFEILMIFAQICLCLLVVVVPNMFVCAVRVDVISFSVSIFARFCFKSCATYRVVL